MRFLTASLHVDYLLPTPLNGPLEVRGSVKEIKGRKVVVESRLIAGGQVCAKGEVVAVQIPEHMMWHIIRNDLFRKVKRRRIMSKTK